MSSDDYGSTGGNVVEDKRKKELAFLGIGILVLLLCVIRMAVVDAGDEEERNPLKIEARYTVSNKKATVKVTVKGAEEGIQKLVYKKGSIKSLEDSDWEDATAIIDDVFSVEKNGKYSILAEDKKGNRKSFTLYVVLEMKGVWIYFDEMNKKATSYKKWKSYINKTFDTCKKNEMNTVIFQVRPFADAMYPSDYFPWSKYATGRAGKNPGFDPFEYAVKAAHERGLAIQAWINPYRIAYSTKISALPKDSIARKWSRSSSSSKRRNVLKMGGGLYFNPASSAVQKLVADGVREIVEAYDVDGIHMDDYFYPSLGKAGYKKFDYREYRAYSKRCKRQGKKRLSLVSWRRNNVNKMVKKVYATVKDVDENCVFGISPAGNIKNLYSKTSYYSPVKTWMKSKKYIDYICPQIYWSFTQRVAPYKKVLKQWTAIKRSSTVDLYIGLAGYRAGISAKAAKAVSDVGWAKSNTILKRQVLAARKTEKVQGYCIFSYGTFTKKSARKEVKNLVSVLKNH